MPAGKIIITADDFGRSSEVNGAIMTWARAGVLTQASLMVNEPGAPAAVSLAREVPSLRVGLHLTLCDGRASDGSALPATPTGAGLRYAFFPSSRAWLRREIEAQFARFTGLGLPATYWDGHTHLHLHPTVMAVTLPIAKRHGFTATRLVREPGPPGMAPWVFQMLSRRAAPRLRATGITFADYVFGLRESGRITPSSFANAFEWSKRGSVEIYFHPGAEKHAFEPGAVRALLEKARES